MYCPTCGKKNDDDARFCAYCGGEIIDTQPEEVSVGEFWKHQLLGCWSAGIPASPAPQKLL